MASRARARSLMRKLFPDPHMKRAENNSRVLPESVFHHLFEVGNVCLAGQPDRILTEATIGGEEDRANSRKTGESIGVQATFVSPFQTNTIHESGHVFLGGPTRKKTLNR